MGVRQDKAKWPKVLIYDMDRTLDKESIADAVCGQNSTLGLDRSTVRDQIVPVFMRGPKTEEQVWWVCSVSPAVFHKIAGSRVYIGMSPCRIVEHQDAIRCFAFQRYGHRAASYKFVKVVCGRSAVGSVGRAATLVSPEGPA